MNTNYILKSQISGQKETSLSFVSRNLIKLTAQKIMVWQRKKYNNVSNTLCELVCVINLKYEFITKIMKRKNTCRFNGILV